MKKRRLENINLIVNVAIVMLIILEWNFQLEALFYCINNLVGKSPSQLDF